jgi:hypothetical protein
MESITVRGARRVASLTRREQRLRSLALTGNNNLATMDGLQGLVEVDGDLIIQGNLFLGTMDGLQGLTRVGGDLIIENNSPALITANLCASRGLARAAAA